MNARFRAPEQVKHRCLKRESGASAPLSRFTAVALLAAATACTLSLEAQQTAAPAPAPNAAHWHHPRPKPPGLPAIDQPIAALRPIATVYPVEGSPDWSVITPDGDWVASARANHVVQLVKATGKVGIIADVNRPCSGLTAGFGAIWTTSCMDKKLYRLDPATGKPVASIDVDPENSEGGIAASPNAIWLVVKPSTLVRIDPKTNTIVAHIPLPSTAADPAYGGGFVWVSTFENNSVVKVDLKKNAVVATIPVGPRPRFITYGAGSVWTLNQGDGTVTRIDAKKDKVVATIVCGIPGTGGDLSFGDGYVWAALFDVPLTQIDPKTNKPIRQWVGPGGDGMRAGGGSVWLSNLMQQTVWRIPADLK